VGFAVGRAPEAKPPKRGKGRSRWRSNIFLTVILIVLLAAGAGLWATQNYLWRLPSSQEQSGRRAVLIDQLGREYPDPSFVTNVTNVLVEAGYSVDYVGPSPTAVEMFRQLPAQGYNLVIIRSHTGSRQSIITSQLYSKSEYSLDQLTGRLGAAQVENGPLYFSLTPQFVRQDMMGSFPGSTVVVMGCSALDGTSDLAEAFLDKGADFLVAWNGPVTIVHTDNSIATFARLISSGDSVAESVSNAGGADPYYGARLSYLDWDTLVQGRISNLVSQVLVWSVLASLVVLGPMIVFLIPKLLGRVERHQPRPKNPEADPRRAHRPRLN
jgi:hypothetical protein